MYFSGTGHTSERLVVIQAAGKATHIAGEGIAERSGERVVDLKKE